MLAADPQPTLAAFAEASTDPAERLAEPEEFVAFMTTDLPPQPEEFQRLRQLNRGRETVAGR